MLDFPAALGQVGRMATTTITMRKLLRNPARAKSVPAGSVLTVTDNGTPELEITRVGRQGKPAAAYARSAAAIFPRPKKFNLIKLFEDEK